MDTITSFLVLLAGVFLRLAIPIVGTAILIYFLRRLDEHWQAEAVLQPVSIQKVDCWKVKGCSPDDRKNCSAASSSLPCWQVFRRPNGYLQEGCMSCKVFIDAPSAVLKIEPRRI
jgi:hypothetical protein